MSVCWVSGGNAGTPAANEGPLILKLLLPFLRPVERHHILLAARGDHPILKSVVEAQEKNFVDRDYIEKCRCHWISHCGWCDIVLPIKLSEGSPSSTTNDIRFDAAPDPNLNLSLKVDHDLDFIISDGSGEAEMDEVKGGGTVDATISSRVRQKSLPPISPTSSFSLANAGPDPLLESERMNLHTFCDACAIEWATPELQTTVASWEQVLAHYGLEDRRLESLANYRRLSAVIRARELYLGGRLIPKVQRKLILSLLNDANLELCEDEHQDGFYRKVTSLATNGLEDYFLATTLRFLSQNAGEMTFDLSGGSNGSLGVSLNIGVDVAVSQPRPLRRRRLGGGGKVGRTGKGGTPAQILGTLARALAGGLRLNYARWLEAGDAGKLLKLSNEMVEALEDAVRALRRSDLFFEVGELVCEQLDRRKVNACSDSSIAAVWSLFLSAFQIRGREIQTEIDRVGLNTSSVLSLRKEIIAGVPEALRIEAKKALATEDLAATSAPFAADSNIFPSGRKRTRQDFIYASKAARNATDQLLLEMRKGNA